MTQTPDRKHTSLATGIAFGVGVQAGMNHYELTGDSNYAVRKALAAMVHVFVFLMLALLAAAAMLSPVGFIIVVLSVPAFGTLWCRNGDRCLFRRGPVYKLFAPIARRVEWFPTWAIYLSLTFFLLVGVSALGAS